MPKDHATDECPKCGSRERNKLGKACQSKPFDPLYLRQYHEWHTVPKDHAAVKGSYEQKHN